MTLLEKLKSYFGPPKFYLKSQFKNEFKINAFPDLSSKESNMFSYALYIVK